jgi:hypothetical protein
LHGLSLPLKRTGSSKHLIDRTGRLFRHIGTRLIILSAAQGRYGRHEGQELGIAEDLVCSVVVLLATLLCFQGDSSHFWVGAGHRKVFCRFAMRQRAMQLGHSWFIFIRYLAAIQFSTKNEVELYFDFCHFPCHHIFLSSTPCDCDPKRK